jgi:hypothetical protein
LAGECELRNRRYSNVKYILLSDEPLPALKLRGDGGAGAGGGPFGVSTAPLYKKYNVGNKNTEKIDKGIPNFVNI